MAEFLLILPRICLIFFTIGTDTLLTYCPTDLFLKTCVIAIDPPSVLLPRISLSQMQDFHLCWTSGDSCQPISPAYISVFQHTYCFSQFDIVPNHTLTKNKLCPIIQVISNEWCLPANQSLVELCVFEPDDPAGFLPNLPSTLPVHTSPLCLEHGKWWEERTKSLEQRGERTLPLPEPVQWLKESKPCCFKETFKTSEMNLNFGLGLEWEIRTEHLLVVIFWFT